MINVRLKTQYVFGAGSVEYLETFLKINDFKKVLLVSGSRSIRENGLYDEIINIFNKVDVSYVEYVGIKPNPLEADIDQAVALGKNAEVEVVIAAGGGSVMDSAKVISLLIANPNLASTKQFYLNQDLAAEPALPVVSIPTTAGTASENNANSVVSFDHNYEKKKLAMSIPSATPVVCLEDSKYLKSNSNWQLASGIFDCFTHLIEQYFGNRTFGWTKEYLFANMRVLYKYALRLLNDRDDVEARDNIMWTTTMSLNSLSSFYSTGDWNIHAIEHAISAKWNVTHGAGLALIAPTYIAVRCRQSEEFKAKTDILANEVFHVEDHEALIELLKTWISDLGLPLKWSDFKEINHSISDSDKAWLIDHVNQNQGRSIILSDKFIDAILRKIPE